MALKVISTDVVVISHGHNPTVLHPKFLSQEKIVGSDMVVIDEQILCTPAVSRVVFESGIAFHVEGERLQISDQSVSRERIGDAKVAEYATRYISALPHVYYTAAGINFIGFLAMPDPGLFIVRRYLNSGTVMLPGRNVSSADVRVTFVNENQKMQLSLSPGVVQLSGESSRHAGVILTGNYHCSVGAASYLEEIGAFLGRYHEFAEDFVEACEHIVRE